MISETVHGNEGPAQQLKEQANKLSLVRHDSSDPDSRHATAVNAHFVTPQDTVIQTAGGGRLPGVPLPEATKLNRLRAEVEGDGRAHRGAETGCSARTDRGEKAQEGPMRETEGGDVGEDGLDPAETIKLDVSSKEARSSLRTTQVPSHTHPLFPQMPLYGPPSLLRDFHCLFFRLTSFFLSLAFLMTIVLGSAFTSIPLGMKSLAIRCTGRDPDSRRPFYEEEKRRRGLRREAEMAWRRDRCHETGKSRELDGAESCRDVEDYIPTEGGRDRLVSDVGYYARRVGLDVEEFKIQTEDGFIISLFHVYDPRDAEPTPPGDRQYRGPDLLSTPVTLPPHKSSSSRSRHRRYPVLLIHGLLQSSGAYCVNDDHSLAFYLAKSGYDVWLGNNRCGFEPTHTLLRYGDPRMWAWNIRQMGVMDLPAFVSRVLLETGFSRLGLVAHSQGTTETFVSLAKEQRPELGEKISVFCALAPAVYAGPLIEKMYLKFMRVISPAMFRIWFGIHAFIPFMMTCHSYLPGRLYGALGYRVFSFLFDWSDERWERDLRDRMFQFSPVYVSAESMRWWLGRECFARHKCILATKEQRRAEDQEDREELEKRAERGYGSDHDMGNDDDDGDDEQSRELKGRKAWYDERAPPMAFWVAGSDGLVDGRRLLRRFEMGREPFVDVVHAKIIEEYEHLDVIWAMDCIEKVGREVREVLWKTASGGDRKGTLVPQGCDALEPWRRKRSPDAEKT